MIYKNLVINQCTYKNQAIGLLRYNVATKFISKPINFIHISNDCLNSLFESKKINSTRIYKGSKINQ